MSSELPYLVVKQNQFDGAHGGIVALVTGGRSGEEFEVGEDDSLFVARYSSKSHLLYVPPSTSGGVNYPGEFRLTDSNGNVTSFYDLPRSKTSLLSDDVGRLYSGSGYAQQSTHDWLGGTFSSTGTTDAYSFGAFKSFQNAAGTYCISTGYDTTTGQLKSITRTDGSGKFERFCYDYSTVTNDVAGSASMISAVTMKRRTGTSGSWTKIQAADYSYYTGATLSAESAFGRLGDLKLVTIKDYQRNPSGDVVDQKYYRYDQLHGVQYDGTEGNVTLSGYGSRGPTNDPITTGGTSTLFEESGDTTVLSGLKSVFEGAAFARLAANRGSISAFADDADVDVNPYANYVFAYERVDPDDEDDSYPDQNGLDTRYRVAQETAAAEGCSTCSDGLGTFKFEYARNNDSLHPGYTTYDHGPNFNDTNRWYMRTKEYLPDTTPGTWTDNDVNIVYTNELGEIMLMVQVDRNGTPGTSDDHEYLTYHQYDNQGREIALLHPSALSGYNEEEPDLIELWYGLSPYVRQDEGLVERFNYATATTATSTSAGDVDGHFKNRYVLRGWSGDQTLVYSQQYYTYVYNGETIYPLASTTEYRDIDDDSVDDQITTTYSYERRLDGSSTETNSILSRTITQQTVEAAQNGSGVANSVATYFDANDRPIWIKDAAGFITRIKYDDVTGAVIERIDDANTSTTSDEPSGWSTPSGGGKHLVTGYEVDGLGRATKITDPMGNATYNVYKDADHEVRTYHSASGTFAQVGPISISRQYWPAASASSGQRDVFTEYLTTSATPTLTSGRPNGNETFTGSILSLSRSLTNNAGQTIETDEYFSVSSLTYSAATSHLGTSSNDSASGNYHATLIDYNAKGLVKRIESPTGTITRKIYDGIGRLTSVWIGTDDDPTTPYWSPDNNTGANMARVTDYAYDFGGIGDGNLTNIIQHIDRLTTASGGSATDRQTRMYYDWRNRLVATKQGVGSETLSLGGTVEAGDKFTITSDSVPLTVTAASTSLSSLASAIAAAINASTAAPFNLMHAVADGARVILYLDDPALEVTVTVSTTEADNSAADNQTFSRLVTHRPLTYLTLDNMGDVLKTQQFNGDNQVLSASDGEWTEPTTSTRRAFMTMRYDQEGRVYATETFGVDSSTGDLSDYPLRSFTWYDSRGNVIKSLTPGGLVTKYAYDSLGRLTKS
ncbi:MAG TPA: RHS repeat domain-containing protein, partial [Tepidisphaeraceae bacterium]